MVQAALIVETNAKFRSNLIPTDQSIAEIAGQKEDEPIVSVIKRLRKPHSFNLFSLSYFLNSKKGSHQRFPV
jgi:hypothetical protein